jgi:hypothetical protein
MSRIARRSTLLVALAAGLVPALAGAPARAQVFVHDTFEDDTVGQPPNFPEVGHYVAWSTPGHTVIDVGGDKWCRTAAPGGTGPLLGWGPSGSTTGRVRLEYAFQIENGTVLTGQNAVDHSLTMRRPSPPDLTTSLSWGDDLSLRIGSTVVGGFAIGTTYLVRWEIDSASNTYDLWINGQQRVAAAPFGADVTEFRDFSISLNSTTTESVRYDDLLLRRSPLFSDGFESGDFSAWSSVEPPSATGDECGDPLSLMPGIAQLGDLGDNTGTTGDDSSCGTGDTIDEWLTVTAPCSGTMTVTTCRPGTEFDTVLAAWGTCGGAELACNDDDPGGSRPECVLGGLNRKSTITFPVVGGSSYRIRVSAFDDTFPGPLDDEYELIASCAP